MEIEYSIKFPEETHMVKVTCECGKCSLLSFPQLEDLRNKMLSYRGKDSPPTIKVIDNTIEAMN